MKDLCHNRTGSCQFCNCKFSLRILVCEINSFVYTSRCDTIYTGESKRSINHNSILAVV